MKSIEMKAFQVNASNEHIPRIDLLNSLFKVSTS